MSKDEKFIRAIWMGITLWVLGMVISSAWMAMERGLWISLVNMVAQLTACSVMLFCILWRTKVMIYALKVTLLCSICLLAGIGLHHLMPEAHRVAIVSAGTVVSWLVIMFVRGREYH